MESGIIVVATGAARNGGIYSRLSGMVRMVYSAREATKLIGLVGGPSARRAESDGDVVPEALRGDERAWAVPV